MTDRPPEPPAGTHRLTNDPVRVVWVGYGLVQAVVVVLMAAELVTARTSAVVTGVALAVYVAVSELFVRPETVPRQPLEELARAAAAHPPDAAP